MDALETIQALCQAYLAECARLERERGTWDGLFGMGGGPKNDPCHDAFAHDLDAALRRAAALPSGEVRPILDYLYRLPLAHRDDQAAYWMLLAVHGLTTELAGGLNRADAAALLAQYRADYPRRERLPAQRRVLDALRARAAVK